MAIEELITMSQREILRGQILEKLKSGALGQSEASKILKISRRQIKRLLRTYRE
ncbi:MAG: helix-turn-helix domain-containing protein [bacterium]